MPKRRQPPILNIGLDGDEETGAWFRAMSADTNQGETVRRFHALWEYLVSKEQTKLLDAFGLRLPANTK